MTDAAPSEYDAVVPADRMPPCPICGKPIKVPPTSDHDRLMVFMAHGMAALGHDGYRVYIDPTTGEYSSRKAG